MKTEYKYQNKLTSDVPRHLTSKGVRIYILFVAIIIPFVSFQVSCKKLLDVESPATSANADNVYSSAPTAIAVLTGIYADMNSMKFARANFTTGEKSISLLCGLSADEFKLYNGVTNPTYISYYKNSLSVNKSPNTGSEYWSVLYNTIFVCNSAIEGLTTTKTLTQSVIQQLLGEAKFLRSFFYFYLVNLFGDVPLVLTTDYKANALLGRTPKAKVIQQIITDLKEAQSFLSPDYLDGSLKAYKGIPERVRPTKWSATALLARVYLFNADYNNAESQSSLVINNLSQYNLVELNNVFLKNSDEAIWQLQPVITGRNTEDAFVFIIPPTGQSDNNPVCLSSNLLSSFEPEDQRSKNWIHSTIIGTDTLRYPYKYKNATQDATVTEYLMVLRLAEQYLIRAESFVHQGKLFDAKSDLNKIRQRAGLKATDASTPETLLTAILHERRVELFSEWGHRWLDLKRSALVNTVMTNATPDKGGIWTPNCQLYPLPLSDVQRNKNLIQNNGY